MPPRSSKAVKDAMTILFEEFFYEVMIAMVKAQPYEAEYAGFHEAARDLTKAQLRLIAKYAAEYYVRETSPSPSKVPQQRVQTLKKAAIAYALKRLAADEEPS
jgi:hypothetical protein